MQYYRENKGQNTEVINYQSSKAYMSEFRSNSALRVFCGTPDKLGVLNIERMDKGIGRTSIAIIICLVNKLSAL